jgi:hypothetical protein
MVFDAGNLRVRLQQLLEMATPAGGISPVRQPWTLA